jgi:glutathione S-transferase
MYRFGKERKFGPGCIEAWRDNESKLTAQVAALAAPLVVALAAHPFLLGPTPTLADAAVWGPLASIEYVKPGWVRKNLVPLADWYERVASAKPTA